MRRTAEIALLTAATWALTACGVHTSDAGRTHTARLSPHVFVELQQLPDGHPPVLGFHSMPSLPDGHPPVPGYHSLPALPEGHPRCPARGSFATSPSDAGMDKALQSTDLIST